MNEELVSALIGIIKVEGLQEATRQINQFSAQMRTAAKDVAKEMGVADKAVDQHKQTFGEMVKANAAQIRTAGRYLTVFGAALTGVVVKAGKEFIEFQRDAANVSTMLSGTISEVSGQMAVYSSGIKDLSIDFNQSTTTLQKGLYDILSASVAPGQALEVLGVSAEAATAGLSTVAIAADAITTVLNSYALEADRAREVSDKLWAIVKRGKITFDEVAGSIGNVASTAAVAGLDFNELGAGIATATRAGVEHRRAMTGMNSVLLAFLKNTDDQKEAASKFGIELSSLTLKTEGLIGVVQKLAGANELGRRATAEEIVAIFQNRRALVALLPILQDVAGYKEDLALMTNSAGLSALAFSKISRTLDFQLGQLGKTLKVMLVDYFEPLVPLIEKIVSVVKSLADTFRDLSPALKAAISTITLLSGVFLTLSGVILMLAPGIIALAGAIGGPALLAVGALAAALIGGGGLVAALIQSSNAVRYADQAVSEHIAKMREAEVAYKSEQKTMERLISRYKDLRAAVDTTTPGTEDRTKAERELQTVIGQIVQIVPEAAIAWDKYGKAIDVNIKSVERSAEIHRQLYDIKQQLRLRDLAEEAVNLRKQQQNRDKEIENIRQQIERERGYLEYLAQERERLLSQKGGEDFMSGPQKSVEEFGASWNSMAGTLAGTLSLSLEEVEQGFIKTEASIARLVEKLAGLNQDSLAYDLTVKELGVHLLDLSEKGIVSEEMLAHLLTTVPKLRGEFERLKTEGVKPLDEELGNLMLTMADVRNAFPNADAWIKSISDGAIPVTKTWKEELEEFNTKVKDAEKSLRSLYESGGEASLEDREKLEQKLVKAINDRAKAVKKAKEEEEKAIKELSDDYRDLMRDFQAFQGANTRTTLVEIKKRQAMYEQDADEWKAWEEVKVEYTQAVAAEITAIWGKMREEWTSGIEGGIADILKGDKNLDDMFKDLGETFAESMADAFSSYLTESLNIEGLFGSTAGMITGGAIGLGMMGTEEVEKILDGIVNAIKDLPEVIAGIMEAIPEIIVMLGEKIPEIIQAFVDALPLIIQSIVEAIPKIIDALIEAIPKIIEAVLEAIPVIIQTICEYIPVIIQTILEKIPDIIQMVVEMIPMIIQQIVEMIPVIITAVVEMIPEIISALIETIPEIIGAIIEAVPQIIGAVIEGIPEIIGAVIEAIPIIVAALVEAIAKAPFEMLGSFGDMFSFGSPKDWFGDIGGFFEDIFGGFGKHGTSGMENYLDRLQDVKDGADTAAGAVEELRWLFYGQEGMGAGEGGYLDDLLKQSFDERQAWFQTYVENVGIYSEEQKNQIRDMMGLWETEAERAAGAVRAQFDVTFQRMKTEMWDRRKGHENRDFDLGGWEEAFSAAYDAAARGEGQLRDLYRKELESQTGEWAKTAEEVEAAMRAFDAAEKDFGDLDISFDEDDIKDDARKAGMLYSDTFAERAKEIDLTDIDLGDVTEKMKDAGYEAGSSYKSGFEEGASGSGILGDVMWDEGVFAQAARALRGAGKAAGGMYKEGFAETSMSAMRQSLIDAAKGMRVNVLPEIPELAAGGIVQRRTNIIAGEDGAEAILPLDRLAEIIRQSGGGENQLAGDTKNEYHITVMLPPGDRNSQEYWNRMTRERIAPALERELSRKGKKLGA